MQVMFSRGRGGLERVFVDHAELLSKRGHTVHCVILEKAAYTPELRQLASQSNGNVVLHICPTSSWRRFFLLWTLRQLITKNTSEVIVAHGAKVTSRLRILRPKSVPLFAVTHNYSPRLMKATHLIALTEHSRKLYEARGFPSSRIHKIPNPLPKSALDVMPRQHSNPNEILIVGTLSRLVEKKGIDIFLRGFRIALDRGLQARAIIGGEGSQLAVLCELCHSLQLDTHVNFSGWIADSQSFYASIDWLCIPSRDEPFGLVALEGFAHGVPVLASAVGGLAEIVTDGSDGVLFHDNDPEALADALLNMYTHRDQIVAIREAAYLSVKQYQPERIGAQIESALLTAVADF